jgi:hypothetical protein
MWIWDSNILLAFTVITAAICVQACDKDIGSVVSQPPSSMPTLHPWPIDLQNVEMSKDDKLVLHRTEYWAHLDTPIEDVRKSLSKFVVVDKDTWLHQYHHVSGGDQGGWIIFPDGERIKWILRPGGLAYIEYADGTIVYLAEAK